MSNFHEEIGFKLLQRYVNENLSYSSKKSQILIQVINATINNDNKLPEMLSIIDCCNNLDDTQHLAEKIFEDISAFCECHDLPNMGRYEYNSTFTINSTTPSKIIFTKWINQEK